MTGIPSPFGADEATFDDYGGFVPDHLPDPGEFLAGHDVLTGADHAAFHRCTRDLFEERTVYDMTFGYNLARLNLDRRHEGAGYRYAEEDPAAEDALDVDGRVLRATFTPTTPFCPQTTTLTVGSFRAWNGLRERHEYDVVRVRAAPMHHRDGVIDERLAALEDAFLETGDASVDPDVGGAAAAAEESPLDTGAGSKESEAPF
jgi:hypothetical protein